MPKKRRIADSGVPDNFAAILAGMDAGIAAGAEDRTAATVAEVAGRAPTSFREFHEPASSGGSRCVLLHVATTGRRQSMAPRRRVAAASATRRQQT